tara:strand:- start:187 stop:357 length:171 start_codon:yes stop_codon:yes gene_type:complete
MPSIFSAILLTVIICLVYCATRYELPEKIYRSAINMGLKTVAGIGTLYVILWYYSL